MVNKKNLIKEKFIKQLENEVNLSSINKKDITKVIKELKDRFKNEDFSKFKNLTEAWNHYWKLLNRIINKFEDKKILPMSKRKEIEDKIYKINKLEGYRAFFFSKDRKSLKYQPRRSYTGDEASSIIRLENMNEVERMIEDNSAIYRHNKRDKLKNKTRSVDTKFIPSATSQFKKNIEKRLVEETSKRPDKKMKIRNKVELKKRLRDRDFQIIQFRVDRENKITWGNTPKRVKDSKLVLIIDIRDFPNIKSSDIDQYVDERERYINIEYNKKKKEESKKIDKYKEKLKKMSDAYLQEVIEINEYQGSLVKWDSKKKEEKLQRESDAKNKNKIEKLKKKLDDNNKFIKSSKTFKTITEYKKIFNLWKIALEIDVLKNKRKNNNITRSDYNEERKSVKYYNKKMKDAKGFNYISLSNLYYQSYNRVNSYKKLILEPKENERKKIVDIFVEKHDVDQYGMSYDVIGDYIEKLVNKYKTNILSDRKRAYEYDYKMFESELTMRKIKKIDDIKDKDIILYILTSLKDEITITLNNDLPYLNYKNDISQRLEISKNKVPNHPLRYIYKKGLSEFVHKELKQQFFGYTGVKLSKSEISNIYHKVYIFVNE